MANPMGPGLEPPRLEPPPATPSKVTGKKVIWIVIIVAAGCLFGIGVLAALAAYGVRKYVNESKANKGAEVGPRLSSGVDEIR